jgi:hypothetical protein
MHARLRTMVSLGEIVLITRTSDIVGEFTISYRGRRKFKGQGW